MRVLQLLLQPTPPPSPCLERPPEANRVNKEEYLKAVEFAKKNGYAIRRYSDGSELSFAVTIGKPPIAAIGISSKHIGEKFIPEIVKKLKLAGKEIEQDLISELPPG